MLLREVISNEAKASKCKIWHFGRVVDDDIPERNCALRQCQFISFDGLKGSQLMYGEIIGSQLITKGLSIINKD